MKNPWNEHGGGEALESACGQAAENIDDGTGRGAVEIPATLTGKVRVYAELEAIKERLDLSVKANNKVMADLEARIIDQMSDEGVSKVSLDGGKTYSARRVLSASPLEGVDRGEIGLALKESGYESLVREDYNTQSFYALVREYDKNLTDGKGGASPEEILAALPEQLRPLVKVTEAWKIASRK